MNNTMVVLQFIKNYIADMGWAPSVREIASAISATSTGTVTYHLDKLEIQGYIVRMPRTARAIRITDEGNEALYDFNRGIVS